ncbi:MAG TPA: CpsD/CapB family tyrosine-protein kinase [Caulobacteraceae bacterium]|nr:CpsD/CapB family tyrosine-protein kinase [Caulobacteraceae bacterium]
MSLQTLAEFDRPKDKSAATGQGSPAAGAISPSLVTLSEPFGKAAEAVRTLRTHVMAQHLREGRRALAVCAPNDGVGCTFVAANLAVALSQVGVRTLLVDADMRDPGIDRIVAAPAGLPGLAQCLASPDMNFAECIDAEVLPDFSVIHAGGAAPNPQELLGSERFGELMDFCLRDFEATIIDTPAANACSDARRVGTVVGYALLVAGRDRTFVEDVRTLAAQLEQDGARVVGTVLNRA